ncbi:hypothetical protein [Actinomadura sp. CNU-125]|uniref:endonuclease toxin domain-containing protein n=1 Tax=Actinomadura sp. CNU-125 TaxID=1904961 RepID=UPI0021CC71F4|nr:hypothetical protein [Actinomadura sp. CNU-125]
MGARGARYLSYAGAGGAGNLAYGWGTSNGNYSPSQGFTDFGIGAAVGGLGAVAGAAAARAAQRALQNRIIQQWSQAGQERILGPLKRAIVKCPGYYKINRNWSDVWNMPVRERGLEIEDRLGGNLPVNFPVIDKWNRGVATSVKSIDLTLPSYKRASGVKYRVRKFLDVLDGWPGRTWGGKTVPDRHPIKKRVLEIVVPRGQVSSQQREALNDMIAEGKQRGIIVKWMER